MLLRTLEVKMYERGVMDVLQNDELAELWDVLAIE